MSPFVIIGAIILVIAVIAFVVFMERALRKIHIQYPRRQVGMKVYDGGSSHLSLPWEDDLAKLPRFERFPG